MNRRKTVLALLVLGAVPLATRAERPSAKVARIGFLGSTSSSDSTWRIDALRAGLRDFGYVEGNNLVIEYRWDATSVAVIPDGRPGAGGSVLLLQKWIHETAKWTALSDEAQSKIIGRTKAESIELADKPLDSHVARTDQDEFGHILRRNVPFGNASMHGTMFVGFWLPSVRFPRCS